MRLRGYAMAHHRRVVAVMKNLFDQYICATSREKRHSDTDPYMLQLRFEGPIISLLEVKKTLPTINNQSLFSIRHSVPNCLTQHTYMRRANNIYQYSNKHINTLYHKVCKIAQLLCDTHIVIVHEIHVTLVK